MDKRPIGIFDSGVGGLTVTREILNLLPEERVIYLGDTANLPYGDKSAEIVRGYARNNTEFLMNGNIKVLVVACNTASSVALDYLKELVDIPIIGVIQPAAKGALYATRNRKVGVIGTNRTVKSNVYSEVIQQLDAEITVESKACPLFVPLIEENYVDHEATRLIASDYLMPFKEKEIDTLILGCTHYPLIRNIISEILPGVKLVDSATSIAKDLYSILDSGKMLSNRKEGVHRFFATDINSKLNFLANRILNMDVSFEEVNLKSFKGRL